MPVCREPSSSTAWRIRPATRLTTDPVLDLEIRPASPRTRFSIAIASAEAEPGANPLHLSAPQDAAPAQGNLIVFRRPLLEPPLLPQPSRDELAEPMNNRPRILEVPEDIMPAVQGSLFRRFGWTWTSRNLEQSRAEDRGTTAGGSDLRARDGFPDGSGRGAGRRSAVCAMAWRALPEIPHTKPFWMGLGAVTLLLWAVYQHLFLLYAGRTLGMSMRGIRLSTFDGRVPAWRQRSRRARSMFVSFAPVTLGFLWALVDEDALCWHDRISQTFPTSE